jgi:hypothetical protein
MKEGELLKKLHEMGCVFVKHCKKHDKCHVLVYSAGRYAPQGEPHGDAP